MSNMDQSKQKKKDFTSSIQENYQNSFGFNVKSLGNLLNQPSDLSTAKDGSAKPASAMSILSGVKSIINGTNSHDTNMNPQTQAQQSAKQMKLLAGIVQKFRYLNTYLIFLTSHLGYKLLILILVLH